MARRRRSAGGEDGEQPIPRLTSPRDQVDAELEARISAGQELLAAPIADESQLDEARRRYHTWHDYNRDLLRKRFTSPSIADEYGRGPGLYRISMVPEPFDQRLDEYRRDLQHQLRRLESVKERLPLYDESPEIASAGGERGGRPSAPARQTLFVVHGHQEARTHELARFLRDLTSLDVVILRERPNQGRTVIEKFEHHAATAAFSVVLLTADDLGGPKNGESVNPRARQNVVFELGFFFGALGRAAVTVLYEEGVELPSDVQGLVYVPLDPAGAWKLQLAKEIRAAGLQVDLNKAL